MNVDLLAADLLISACLGDPSIVDSPFLLRDYSIMTLGDISIREWTDIVAGHWPNATFPGLESAIRHLISSYGEDLLALIFSLGSTIHVDQLEFRGEFTWEVACPTHEQIGAMKPLPFKIADGHVHSGAVFPFETIVRAICTVPVSQLVYDSSRPLLVSRSGMHWSPSVCIQYIRIAIRYIWLSYQTWDLDDSQKQPFLGFTSESLQAIRGGLFWKSLIGAPLHFPESWTETKQVGDMAGNCPPLNEIFSWAVGQSAHMRSLMLGLLRVLQLLYGYIFSKSGEGLTRFVSRFDDMRLVRDTPKFLVSKNISVALAHNLRSANATGMEFRSLIRANAPKDATDKIRQTLSEHLEAFVKFCGETGRRVALTMPISAMRQPSIEEWPTLASVASNELRQAFLVVDAVNSLLYSDADGELATVIHSIDTVGDEVGSANWPFLAAYEKLDSRLTRTIHAGESFTYPLNGIRRVGEIFRVDNPPTRIGHGLSLGGETRDHISRARILQTSVRDALIDLAWCAHIELSSTMKAEARDLAFSLLRPLEGRGRSLDVDVVFDVVGSLYQVSGLTELGVLSDNYGGSCSVPDFDFVRDSFGSARTFAAAHFLFDLPSEVHGAPLQRAVTNVEATALMSFSDKYSAEASDFVLARIKDRNCVLESCPTSNIVLSGIKNLTDHPMWEWSKMGIVVTASTDDPVIFGTSIDREFRNLIRCGPLLTVREIAKSSVQHCSGGSAQSRGMGDYQKLLARI